MSRQIMLSTVFACGCAIALHAQTPTSQQPGPNRGEMTVTGCVERADQIAQGAAAATVDSLTFVLIHAAPGTAADQPAVGTSGTKADANATGKTYRLDSDASTLNPHVGHKVEVTGTLDAPTAPSVAGSEPSSPETAPRLKVARLKMVAETCAR